MSGDLFYGAAIAFMGGIFLRSFFDVGNSEVFLLVILSVAFLVSYRFAQRDEPAHLTMAVVCAFAALGIFRLDVSDSHGSDYETFYGREIVILGEIAREPELRERLTHLYVRPFGEKELILVTADRYEAGTFKYGDHVRAEGTLKRPEPFLTDGGRMFDYEGYQKARGVRSILPFADTEIEDKVSSPVGTLYEGKHAFIASLRGTLPEPISGLGEGVLLGVRNSLGENLEETFRKTGLIHIVVLSGYNVMIVVSTVLSILSFFFYPKTRMVIGLVAIVLFAILVGFSATVVRASVMAALLLVAHVTGRTYAVLRALMLAGVLMLLLNPYLLAFDPGFQLSFLATLGLILIGPHFEAKLVRIPLTLGMRGFVAATLATQIMVLPLLLYHTGLLSFVSVPANVLVLPMVPVAMFLTFLTGIAGMVSTALATFFGFFSYLALGYIIKIAELLGELSGAAVSVPAFPFPVTFAAYAILATVLFFFTRKVEEKAATSTDLREWTIIDEESLMRTEKRPRT